MTHRVFCTKYYVEDSLVLSTGRPLLGSKDLVGSARTISNVTWESHGEDFWFLWKETTSIEMSGDQQ